MSKVYLIEHIIDQEDFENTHGELALASTSVDGFFHTKDEAEDFLTENLGKSDSGIWFTEDGGYYTVESVDDQLKKYVKNGQYIFPERQNNCKGEEDE